MVLDIFYPAKISDTVILLSKYDNVKILAGGTDLILDIKKDRIDPQYLIDIKCVDTLKDIIEENENIIIGSMVTFSQLLESSVIKKYYNNLVTCAKGMGSPQIRNMATIGGNIINAQAAADIIPCIMCLDGELVFESIDGVRKLSCHDYFVNYSEEKIKDNEILTKIIIPKNISFTGYYKLGKRNSLVIARIITAIRLEIYDSKIVDMRISLGAVGKLPFRVKEIELLAKGKPIEWLISDEPLKVLEKNVYESIKTRASMPFKKEAIKGVYKSALRNAGVIS